MAGTGPVVGGVARGLAAPAPVIGGVKRASSGLYVAQGGVEREIWTGVPAFDPVLNNNSWDTIAAVSAAGYAAQAWTVGQAKTVQINGFAYQMVIIGFDHDALAPTDAMYGTRYNKASNMAGITFSFKHIYQGFSALMNEAMTNAGGWGQSDMRKTTMPRIKKDMPSDLVACMRSVAKRYCAGNALTSNITSSVDDLFVLAYAEVYDWDNAAGAGRKEEGPRYPYYNSNARRVKTNQYGTTCNWWLRSTTTNDTCFIYCDGGGNVSGIDLANGYKYTSPAFCI